MRCAVIGEADPGEVSLAENVAREPMHPADQVEAFARLAQGGRLGAEEIAARFGVTPAVVRQRLRLGGGSKDIYFLRLYIRQKWTHPPALPVQQLAPFHKLPISAATESYLVLEADLLALPCALFSS